MSVLTSCRDASLAISESADRRLSPMRWVAMQLHLLMCAACRRYRRQIRRLDMVLRRRGRQSGTDGISPARREQIKNALRNQRINPSD